MTIVRVTRWFRRPMKWTSLMQSGIWRVRPCQLNWRKSCVKMQFSIRLPRSPTHCETPTSQTSARRKPSTRPITFLKITTIRRRTSYRLTLRANKSKPRISARGPKGNSIKRRSIHRAITLLGTSSGCIRLIRRQSPKRNNGSNETTSSLKKSTIQRSFRISWSMRTSAAWMNRLKRSTWCIR